MRLAVATNVDADGHETNPYHPGHPEQPWRSRVALEGLADAGLAEGLVQVGVEPAPPELLQLVHTPAYLSWLESFCATGGGTIDQDTVAAMGSWLTARLAAAAGPALVAALDAGQADAGFVIARPPGHHALPAKAMGFCLLNNIAITAALLVARGERVAIIDWDVHHGNGTQDIFWDDPAVLYVSVHQQRLFPGTGRVAEIGGPRAEGLTINMPLTDYVTGDVLRHAFDVVVAPAVARFEPTWVLVSAGFDGHYLEPNALWSLTAGDYAELADRVVAFAPEPRRLIAFLEGGYHPAALLASVGATAASLVGERYEPEPMSEGGPGMDEIDSIAGWRANQTWSER